MFPLPATYCPAVGKVLAAKTETWFGTTSAHDRQIGKRIFLATVGHGSRKAFAEGAKIFITQSKGEQKSDLEPEPTRWSCNIEFDTPGPNLPFYTCKLVSTQPINKWF